MNKILLIALAGALSTGSLDLRAQSDTSVTTNVALVSQYMFRGQRLGGMSVQPSVEIGGLAEGRLALGVWYSKPMTNAIPDVSDPEVDFYGSYTIELTERLNLVPGFTTYFYPGTTNAGHKQTHESSLALTYSVAGVQLMPKVYYDHTLEGGTLEIAGAHSIALSNLGITVDLSATYGTSKWDNVAKNVFPQVKNWGSYFSVGFSLPLIVTPDSRMAIGYAYHKGWQNKFKQGGLPQSRNSLQASRGVGSVNYSLSF
jgi:uncharacterized protein (TIGR02001 family)